MQKVKTTGNGILFGGMVFLLFLAVFESFLQIPSWLAVAGRMHPMFLHFPIVLLLVSFFTLWIPVSRQGDNEWLGLLRLAAALSAVVAAIMGMLLSLEGDRAGQTLTLHKWGGVLVALAGFVFYTGYPFLARKASLAKPFTVIAAIAILLTGHWGAGLTHGEDYVLAPIRSNGQRLVPPEEAVIFADVVRPILEQKCISCHGASSVKGGLTLKDVKGLMAGGKTGPLFIPGQPDASLLIKRLHLPLGDKKRMPPASKPQLTEEEAALLYAWVKSGAATDEMLFSLPEKDTFRVLATAYLAPAAGEAPTPVYDFAAADESKIASLNNNYRSIVPLGKNSPALTVNFYGRNVYSTASLEEILPLKQQIVELNLSRLPVKDGDMKVIRQLEQLRKLNLNYTGVTSAGVEELAGLQHLEELALSGTGITSAALDKLLSARPIPSVYIWDTKIDSNQVSALKKKFEKVYIESGFTDKDGQMIALSPPVISTPAGVFNKSIQLEMKHPFKDAEIRYTLDGTPPDSLHSPVYTAPLAIDKNVTVTAKAFKPGWYGSKTVQSSFIKRGVTPDSIILATNADPRYAPTSATLLADGQLGDFANYGNGEWFGYQRNEAAYYLLFNKPVTVQSVMLSMMQNLGGHIFPPVKMEVWGGMQQDQLKPLGKVSPPAPDKGEPARLIQGEVTFAPAEVQCIRLVVHPLASLPAWHGAKGKPGWVFISEIIVN